MTRLLLMAVMVVSSVAFAEVGKIAQVDGEATRKAKDGATEALKKDTKVEVGDTLEVKSGFVKFELNDGSVIALAEKARLVITEADFEGQERKGFSAILEAGSLWTKVKKALGGAKYEVQTERAVAGVRGTIFRIDADTLVKANKGKGQARKASIVRVVEGAVNVKPSAMVAKASKAQVKPPPAKKGPRVQVAGPQEITADEWENKFVELQKNQQVIVGVDLWEQAEIEEAVKADAFSKWVEKNQ